MVKISNRTSGMVSLSCIKKELGVGESIVLESEIVPKELLDLVSYGIISVMITDDLPKTEELKTKKNKAKEE